MNAFVWLAWAACATLAVAVTRNPLYLSLALVAVTSTYLAVDRLRPLGHAPSRLPLRAGVAIAFTSVLFNALTAHVGDQVLGRLPPNWPIIGGPITLNAVLYGLLTATVLFTLLLVVAVLDGGLDRAQALRLLPSAFSNAAVAVAIGLTAFPFAVRAIREIREAQQVRGLSGSPLLRARSIVVPVLHRALEHAFAVAETLESRAYGTETPSRSRGLLVATLGGVFALTLGVIGGDRRVAASGLLIAIVALTPATRGILNGLRRLRWTRAEIITLAMTLAGATLWLSALAFAPAELSYSTYPRLAWPPFDTLIGLGYLSLVAPALLLSGVRQ